MHNFGIFNLNTNKMMCFLYSEYDGAVKVCIVSSFLGLTFAQQEEVNSIRLRVLKPLANRNAYVVEWSDGSAAQFKNWMAILLNCYLVHHNVFKQMKLKFFLPGKCPRR